MNGQEARDEREKPKTYAEQVAPFPTDRDENVTMEATIRAYLAGAQQGLGAAQTRLRAAFAEVKLIRAERQAAPDPATFDGEDPDEEPEDGQEA